MKTIILSSIILLLIVSLRLLFFFQAYDPYKSGDTIDKTITLLSTPKISFSYQIFYVDGVRVEADSFPELSYGDRVRVRGVVEERFWNPQNSTKEIAMLYVKKPEIQLLEQSNIFIKTASYLRHKVYGQFLKTIPHTEAVLLFGIVFGGSEGFSREMEESFKNTGVLHVVAASGMNVTMVSVFLLAVFSQVLKRRDALVVTICGIFYYALISGFEPSILRASLMISIVLIASLLGRQNYGFLSLLITGAVMLCVSPLVLFNVGFLLSFTSTLGILMIKPLFDSIKLFKKVKVLSDDVGTSLSAQIGSLPVVLGTFSAYSFISILVNALVLWTIPFLMILGGIAAFCSIALPFVSFIPLYIALPFLWFFEKTVVFFGKIPLVSFESISLVFFIGYYLILLSLILVIRKYSNHEN